MRRSRLISTLIALAVMLSGSLILTTPGANAETANPEIAIEGWFARNKPRSPQVDVPCSPTPPIPNPPTGCGPANPGEVPSPQSPATGAFVVSSAGGNAGDRSEPSGDTGWTAFQWDLFSYFEATVDKFTVTLFKAPDARGDYGTPVISACNIATPWAAAPGSNPWADRPTPDAAECVVPTVGENGAYVFEFTTMAQTWIDGTGYGIVIVPGTPTTQTNLRPFQITFAGYTNQPTSSVPGQAPPEPRPPVVTFQYTPGLDDDGLGGGDDDGFEDIFDDGLDSGTDFDTGSDFDAAPDIDVFPTDVGSDPVEEVPADDSGDEEVAVGPTRTRPVSNTPGFPMAALLFLPLVALAFWGAGTALGPLGEPVPAREGGVSRVLARRQATRNRFDDDEVSSR